MALLYSILDVQLRLVGSPVRHAEAIVFATTAVFNCRAVFVLGTSWHCHAPIAVHMFVVFSNLKVIKLRSLGVSVRLGVGPPPVEPPIVRRLKKLVSAGMILQCLSSESPCDG